MDFRLPYNGLYTFASPRYNCIVNFPSVLVPEDYRLFDSLNGTADKYFPCYTLLQGSSPKTVLYNNLGIQTEHEGVFGFREHSKHRKSFKVGKKDNPASPSNKNLFQAKVFTDRYITTNLNPGWCVIQTVETVVNDETVYTPNYVVRVLGNNSVTKELYAINLDDEDIEIEYTNASFVAGDIAIYKQNLFKCIKETNLFPPKQLIDNEYWKSLNMNNVFNADLFTLTNKTSSYVAEVGEEDRRFNPDSEDDSLICFNIAYWHE